MIVDMIDQKIRKAFSDAALQYDVLASLQREIGRELTKKIQHYEPCSTVLDIGMGTGWFTNRLTNVYPDAMVVGLDFASGMIASAQNRNGSFKIIQADAAHLPFKDGAFDIITSNLAYQWIQDLLRAFELSSLGLKKGGVLSLTMFGYDTLSELFTALETCAFNKNLPVQRLANRNQVLDALKNTGFQDVNVSSEQIKVRFSDMMSMVKWVKGIGANVLAKDVYLGKDLLLKANDYYNAHYSDRLGVYATFEVIWVEARR